MPSDAEQSLSQWKTDRGKGWPRFPILKKKRKKKEKETSVPISHPPLPWRNCLDFHRDIWDLSGYGTEAVCVCTVKYARRKGDGYSGIVWNWNLKRSTVKVENKQLRVSKCILYIFVFLDYKKTITIRCFYTQLCCLSLTDTLDVCRTHWSSCCGTWENRLSRTQLSPSARPCPRLVFSVVYISHLQHLKAPTTLSENPWSRRK